LSGWVEEHRERTGSPVAERLLADWDAQLARFVKVMPHDYKRALLEATQPGNGSARTRPGRVLAARPAA
jgi:glutamate synthase domain-containing protein 3